MESEEGRSLHESPRTTGYRRSLIHLALSLAALVLVLLLPARAQDGSTSLQGLVEDLSGARIAGAEVALANSDNGYRATAKSDGEGRFHFAMLAPGNIPLPCRRRGWLPRRNRA